MDKYVPQTNAAAAAAFRAEVDEAVYKLIFTTNMTAEQAELIGYDCFVERLKHLHGEYAALNLMLAYLKGEVENV